MAAFAPVSLRAQTSPANNASPSVAPAPSESTALEARVRDSKLNKVVEGIKGQNKKAALDPNLTRVLGLTKNGEALTLQYRAFKDDDGNRHGLFLLQDQLGYVLFLREKKEVTVGYMDSALHLVSAVRYLTSHQSDFSSIPLPEGAKKLNEEILMWKYVDAKMP